MRTAYKAWGLAAIAVFSIVAVTGLSTPDVSRNDAPISAATPSSSPASTTVRSAPTTTQIAGERVDIAKVLDGRTFTTSDGRTVRILGLSTCKPSTHGGKEATSLAQGVLEDQSVVLTREDGVGRDDQKRELRYVAFTWGGDVAEYLVGFDGVSVDDKSRADAAYLTELRDRDMGPLQCSRPASTGGGSLGDESFNGPSPGDQGLPDGALTGGYCARKWWC